MLLQGKSFEPILLPRPNATWLIEPTVVPLDPDNTAKMATLGLLKEEQPEVEDPQALALFRTKAGVLYQSIGYGRDARQWSQPEAINVRNPDSKVPFSHQPQSSLLPFPLSLRPSSPCEALSWKLLHVVNGLLVTGCCP